MSTPLRIDAGELTADELIEELTAGRRVLLSVELFGTENEVSLRYDGDTYYCDTPTQLHKHDDEAAMRACIEEMGYADSDTTTTDGSA
jgi:hemin uptake protein HemP